MIYTVGVTESYRKWFAECAFTGERFEKIGILPEQNYLGGYVWRTASDAAIYLDKEGLHDFSVWEVDAEWEDTLNYDDEPFNRLVYEALIVREVPFYEV